MSDKQALKDQKSTASHSCLYHLLGYLFVECNQPHCFLLCNLTVATVAQQKNDAKGRMGSDLD